MKNLASDGMHSGATSAPTVEPALKIEVAKARSRLGKYSAVTFTAEGKLPDSPTASTTRAAMKKYTLTIDTIEATSPVARIMPAVPDRPT